MSSDVVGVDQAFTVLLLQKAADDFVDDQLLAKRSSHTVKAYRTDIKVISSLLAEAMGIAVEDLAVSDLTPERLRAAFLDFSREHSKASILRSWSVWNQFTRFLAVRGELASGVMELIPRPKPDKRLPKGFTSGEVTQIIRAARLPAEGKQRTLWPERDLAIVGVLITTGLRASEMLSLKIGSISGEKSQYSIRVHGKGNKERAIPVPDATADAICGYLNSRFPDLAKSKTGLNVFLKGAENLSPLWVDTQGRKLTSAQLEYLIAGIYRRAGVSGTRTPGALIHALRHTFATMLIEHGASAPEVMQLLGHEELASTQRYVTARQEHLRSAVQANPAVNALTHDD